MMYLYREVLERVANRVWVFLFLEELFELFWRIRGNYVDEGNILDGGRDMSWGMERRGKNGTKGM